MVFSSSSSSSSNSSSFSSDDDFLYDMNQEATMLFHAGFIACRVKASLGGTTRNHLKEQLRNQKWPNHFLGPFTLNVFTTICIFFPHVYPSHALIYGLKFILEFKKLEIVKSLYS
jgi:hypothetical protein